MLLSRLPELVLDFFHKNRCFSFEWQRFVPTRPGGCCGTAIDVVIICGGFTRCGADVAQLSPLRRGCFYRQTLVFRFRAMVLLSSVGVLRRLISHLL